MQEPDRMQEPEQEWTPALMQDPMQKPHQSRPAPSTELA